MSAFKCLPFPVPAGQSLECSESICACMFWAQTGPHPVHSSHDPEPATLSVQGLELLQE